MSKLKDFVLNHKKVFTIAASAAAAVAVLGCGVLVGYKAAGKSNQIPTSNYSQPDVNNGAQNTPAGGVLQNKAPEAQNSADAITPDEAKDIALRDAGYNADEVTIIKSETENDEDIILYDVEFIGGDNKYEYEINAKTGEIMYFEREPGYNVPSTQPNQPDNNAAAVASISLDEAKAIALADSGMTDVTFTKAKLDHDDNRDVYEIEFYSGTVEYDYEIEVYGGNILKKDIEFNDSKKADIGQDIGIEAAKEAAVKDAGLKAEDVSFTKTKKDTDDGISVYEIEFTANDTRYEYEINATNGRIIKEEIVSNKPANTVAGNTQGIMNLEAAKDIALSDADVKAEDATFTKTKLDRDDGRDVYDIEFYTSSREYEYEIDAQSGKILDMDTERLKGSTTLKTTGDYIGIEEAKKIALKHCGLSASDVTFTTAKQDRDDGVDCYELEFCTSEHEYEYEIHCVSGEILHDECHKHDWDDNDCGHSRHH